MERFLAERDWGSTSHLSQHIEWMGVLVAEVLVIRKYVMKTTYLYELI